MEYNFESNEIECMKMADYINRYMNVFNHECSCNECKYIATTGIHSIEEYIQYRGKQEACNCNKCCWCYYKNTNNSKKITYLLQRLKI